LHAYQYFTTKQRKTPADPQKRTGWGVYAYMINDFILKVKQKMRVIAVSIKL